MADTAISDMTPMGAAPAADDELEVRDTSESESRRLAISDLMSYEDIDHAVLGLAAGHSRRVVKLTAQDGSGASTIKIKAETRYNGDAITEEDNVGKESGGTYFSLDATGSQLEISAAGVSGTPADAFCIIERNQTTVGLNIHCYIAAGSAIRMIFYSVASGAVQDLTTLADTGSLQIRLEYYTSA